VAIGSRSPTGGRFSAVEPERGVEESLFDADARQRAPLVGPPVDERRDRSAWIGRLETEGDGEGCGMPTPPGLGVGEGAPFSAGSRPPGAT